jgi:hypothetical protein
VAPTSQSANRVTVASGQAGVFPLLADVFADLAYKDVDLKDTSHVILRKPAIYVYGLVGNRRAMA